MGLASKGAVDEAIAEYSRAIQLAPEDTNLWHFRGEYFLSLRRYQQALDDFAKVVELDPKNHERRHEVGYELWNHLRLISNKGGDHHQLLLNKAIVEFREAIRLKSDAEGDRNLLCAALVRAGQLDEAIATCRESIQLNPDAP